LTVRVRDDVSASTSANAERSTSFVASVAIAKLGAIGGAGVRL
jgi:hypothetical protein